MAQTTTSSKKGTWSVTSEVPVVAGVCNHPNLYLEVGPGLFSVHVRGNAYLLWHKGREGGAEFQKILEHRGTVLNEPTGALARLGLGRAYAVHVEAGQGGIREAEVITVSCRSEARRVGLQTRWSGAVYRFARDVEVDLDELRTRLRRMSDEKLLRFGKAARFMLEEARAK